MLRVALLSVLSGAAAQDCGGGGADLGTDACACYMIPCADVTSMGTPVTKTLSVGPVTGRAQGGIERYFGVNIAQSSAGANRWKPPQALTPATVAVEATTEKQCPQYMYPVAGTENCIGVDIMLTSGLSNMPAALWIHGGGFTSENPFFQGLTWAPMQNYAFSHLPNGGKSVTFLAHYRLGALGWMSHPGFVETTAPYMTGFAGTNPGAGNYGMMDTLFAIKFIHTNADALGIDATKVTVFGESAGGAHTCMLIASPLSQGLVTTFIAESPYISFHAATFSMKARQEMDTLFTLRAGTSAGTGCITTAAVAAVGSTAAATEAACLRGTSIVDLIVDTGFGGPASGGLAGSLTAVAAFEAVYGATSAGLFLYNSIHVWPVVDGYALTKAPLDAYSSGINAAANLVIGHNSDEYGTFCFWPPFGGPWICETAPDRSNEGWILGIYYLPLATGYAEIFAAVTAAMAGSKIAQLKAGMYYSDINDPIEQMTIQMGTDAWFATGNLQAIEANLVGPGRAVGTVYHYVFAQETDPQYPKMGACHGCELTYVLGFYKIQQTYLSNGSPASAGGQTIVPTGGSTLVGMAMNSYWASIFWYGTPNTVGSGLPQWVPMAITDKNTMTFKDDYPTGAMMNPCVRWTMCKTEPTKDWRRAQKHFWGSAPAAMPVTLQTCTGPVMAQPSHAYSTSLGYSCSFKPCCKYSATGRRNLLFGMPDKTDAACDAAC